MGPSGAAAQNAAALIFIILRGLAKRAPTFPERGSQSEPILAYLSARYALWDPGRALVCIATSLRAHDGLCKTKPSGKWLSG